MDSDSVDAIITDPPYGINYQSQKNLRVLNDHAPFIWWLYDAYRVLKSGGCLCCFTRWDVAHVFLDAIRIAGFTVKSEIIWNKVSHGMGDCKAQFAPTHETILFAVKGKFAFPAHRPKDIITVPKVASAHMVHPTEKPVQLMTELISAVTKSGMLVLDPFAGSGSTLVAAKAIGRRYLGVELDDGHYMRAMHRLEGEAYEQTEVPNKK